MSAPPEPVPTPVRCRVPGAGPDGPRVWALAAPAAAPGAPPEARRALARRQARAALRVLLADACGGAPDSITLSTEPGQPLRALQWPQLGLSISHERQLSLLACWPGGDVGVDVVAHDATASTAELQRVAQIYLGQEMASEKAPVAVHPSFHAPDFRVFAEAWARHEAGLKCLHLPLTEWTPALAARLAGVRAAAVELPAWAAAHCSAAVAWRAAAPSAANA